MNAKQAFRAAGFLCLVASNAFAATLYVDAGNLAPSFPFASWGSAANTIQQAVDAASDGDEIIVTNGIYASGGRVTYGSLTNRVAVTKAVAVRSVNGPLVTLIQGYQVPGTVFGDAAVRCVYLTNWASLSGFTLTNGATRGAGQQILEESGGGLWCEYFGSATNCIITGNVAPWYGGGAFGGTLNNCLIIGNSSTNNGGGASSNYVNNCTLVGNSSMYGAGGAGGAVLRNSIIYFNTGFFGNHSVSFFHNCDTTPAPSGGTGNFNADPLFVDLAGRNLRLQSNSPCINTGDNGYAPASPDLDGNVRIFDGTVDMGAYEFQGTAAAVSPYVITQPTNQTVNLGSNALFYVLAGGSPPFTYQWRFNDSDISGATTNPLVLKNVQLTNAGNYSVAVSNSVSWILSSNALLTVNTGTPPLIAGTHYVNVNATNPVPPYTNWASAALNIQDAIDVAAPGDEIVVTNGVYATGARAVSGTMSNRVVVSKPLYVHSVNGAQWTAIAGYQVPGVTNGDGAIRCVYLTNGAVLAGFTVTNGATLAFGGSYSELWNGGGVFSKGSGTTISNCLIVGNSAGGLGGGAELGTLYNCTLVGNWTSGGGGGASDAALYNCLLKGNSADHGGGADLCTLNNCLIITNSAANGGGAYVSTCNNCTVTGNSASNNGGGTGYSTVYNSIVYFNNAPTNPNYLKNSSYVLNYSCTTPQPPDGSGNITSDPLFVGPAAGNFHLQTNSPCVNAGNNSYAPSGPDLDGNTRILGGIVDMGAYESQAGPGVAPYIITQPTNRTVVAGASTTFNVAAGGTLPLQYQWRFNGAKITGATTNPLVLVNVQLTNAGNYSVFVSNSVSWTLSSNAFLTVLSNGSPPSATIHYVNAGNLTPASPYTNWAGAAVTIQDAVDVAAAGDEILVSNGIYSSGGRAVAGTMTNRVAVTKPLFVHSVNGPAFTMIQGYQVPGTTNGDGAIRCVYLTNGASLSGFTLTNGATRSAGDLFREQEGGGLFCESLNATVSNCVVVANSSVYLASAVIYGTLDNCIVMTNAPSSFYPGVIYGSALNHCTVLGNAGGGINSCTANNCLLAANALGAVAYGVLSNCTLSANSSYDGGAVFYSTLYGCVLSGNSATNRGGGAYQGTLYNCLLTGNSALYGGGAAFSKMVNCTVVSNSASSGGGVFGGTMTNGFLTNCIVYFNSAPDGPNYAGGGAFTSCCTTPDPGGTGNVIADPVLVDLVNGNLRLQSNSPCIDAGNNGYAAPGPDLDGHTRIVHGTVDIGAYEYQGPFPKSTHYVNVSNLTPSPPYTNWLTAATNIQDAVDASVAGDEIVVTNGVYATGGRAVYGLMTNRVAVDKAVSVHSLNGPRVTFIQGYQVPGTTNGDGAIRCVYLASGANLFGFTLTNGATRGGAGDLLLERSGGGAWCESWSAVISNCIVAGNSASANGEVHGGSVYDCILTNNRVGASSCFASNCVLSGNSEGAVYLCTLYDCTLTNNGYGANQCTVNNCLILGNHGSGADFSTVNNSVLFNNWGPGRGNAFGSTLNNCTLAGDPSTFYATAVGSSTLKNCVLYYTASGSSTFSYCCTWPYPYAVSGPGNINLDPKLMDVAAGNFRLMSSSPCINAGLNADAPGSMDLDGNPRIFGGTVDIGAYEFQGPPTPTAPYFLSQPQPASVTVYAGTNVTFTASVYGTPPLSYQWNFEATGPLSGQTNTSLTLTNVQVNQSGNYFLVVTNLAGKATSSNALLTVNPAPVAGNHYVDSNSQDPIFPYTNWLTAATNIQDAINASTNGDVIVVTNGIYASGGGPNGQVVIDRAVTVRSANGPLWTFIDGGGSNRCVYLYGGATLIGFTVTNGYSYNGAGISSSWFLGGTVQNCVIIGNSANPAGGGVGGGAVGGTLNNCLLAYNTAYQGAGAYFSSMNNCTVVSNSAIWEGGGIWSTNGTLNNCILYYNTAPYGSNWAGSGFRAGPAAQSFCCTIPSADYTDITNAPLFVDLVGGNFRLASNSPCINAGTNFYVVGSTDLDGRPRIVGGTVDIGAYEFQPDASGAFIGWLQLNGLPTDGSADNVDSDGDGLSNWQEYLASRNPLVWDNITLQAAPDQGDGFQLLVHGEPGITYSLQAATTPGFWTTITQVDCATSNGTAIVVDPASKNYPQRFYRVMKP